MATPTVSQQTWTILTLLNWCTEYLTQKGFDSPRLTTELLLSHVLQCQRIDLYTDFDKPIASDELMRFKTLLKRRLGHEPLQYILGETEFMGMKFNVDARVLIPRPETELLVEQIIELSRHSPVYRILDVGTGSGNIALSLAKFIDVCNVDAIDSSPDALAVAEENLSLHQLDKKVKFHQIDVLNDRMLLFQEQYDVIVSNPPYISRSEFATLQPEVRDFEPRIATTDDKDGMTFFKRLADIGKKLLTSGGWMFLEVAYNQGGKVMTLLMDAGYTRSEAVKDYSNIPRIVKARWMG